MERPNPNHNDHRADHIVNVFPGASNVTIPYKGFLISLAADGADTCVFKDDDDKTVVVNYNVIHGTGGDAIKRAIQIIDLIT